MYGVGYAANYMGLSKSFEVASKYANSDEDDIIKDIATSIFASYVDAAYILYGTVCLDKDIVEAFIYSSINKGYPYDISTGVLDENDNGKNILCSIMLDVNILDTLSKIITMMVTCNQALLQGSNLNIY
jgi:hypothetical protein